MTEEAATTKNAANVSVGGALKMLADEAKHQHATHPIGRVDVQRGVASGSLADSSVRKCTESAYRYSQPRRKSCSSHGVYGGDRGLKVGTQDHSTPGKWVVDDRDGDGIARLFGVTERPSPRRIRHGVTPLGRTRFMREGARRKTRNNEDIAQDGPHPPKESVPCH